MEHTIAWTPNTDRSQLIIFSRGNTSMYPLSGHQTFGRIGGDRLPDIAVPYRVISREHGQFFTDGNRCRYMDVGSTNGSSVNGCQLLPHVAVELQDGDVIRIHVRNNTDTNEWDVVMIYTKTSHTIVKWNEIRLDHQIGKIDIGRAEQFQLNDGRVSRKHASFFFARQGWAVIDHESKNGVYMNGSRLIGSRYLRYADVIRIADYYFLYLNDTILYPVFQENATHASSRPVNQEVRVPKRPLPIGGGLCIDIEERNVWERTKKKTLLRDIKMDIPKRSMVLILGGSGAGKTTFLNAVMGYEPADAVIRYAGTDIYEEYEKMKYEIGYVPQQDLLRMNDTVRDTLFNAAKMRLPRGSGESYYAKRVSETLQVLGLGKYADSLVGKLSGGQRKRLSIAVEYIGNPSLFFLDEPDSGLDGTMAVSLMENLRTIADQGKIVLVISHSPDRAFDLFDKIIVLAKSSRDDVGRLAFFGSPKEALSFFGVETLEQIVKRINRPDEGGDGMADHFIAKYKSGRSHR